MQKLLLLALTIFTLHAHAQTSDAWQQTSGPEGGYVFDLCRNASTVYAGTDNGLWTSADEGLSWSPLSPEMNDLRIHSIYVKDSEILALATKFLGQYHQEGYFFRSSDAGITWTQNAVSATPPYINLNNNFGGIKLWREGNRIWIKNNSGLYFSEDDGTNWSAIAAPSNVYLSDAAVSGTEILAYYNYAWYRTNDLGANWTSSTDLNYVTALYGDGQFLLCLKADSIFASQDFGQNWQGTPSDFYALDGLFRLSNGAFAMMNGILQTSADGLNWQTLTQPGVSANAKYGVEAGANFIVGGSYGIFRTVQNNTQFEPANNGFIGSRLYALVRMPNGKLIASVTYSGLWSSSNNGISWEKQSSPLYYNYPVEIIELSTKGDTLWAIGSNDSLYQQIGNSNTWNKVLDADAWYAGESFLRIFGNNIYLVEDAQIRRSQNGGSTWNILTGTSGFNSYRDIAEFGNYLFYSTNDGEVFRSSDVGLTWQNVYEFWSPGAHRYNKLGVSGGRIIVWSESESFSSIDNGQSWQKLEMAGLPLDAWGDINFAPLDIKYFQNLIICTIPYEGVWLSFDQGNSWEPMNSGLTHLRGRRLAINGSNIFMGASTSGVWKLETNFEVYSGQVYNDLNQNGQKDTGELPLKSILVSAEPLGSYTASDASGAFSLVAASSLDSIRVTLPNNYCSVMPLAYLASQTGFGYDFGIHFTEGIIDLSLDMANWAPFRPGYDNELTLTVSNLGNETVTGAWVELALPSQITVLYTNPFGVASITNDTLRWQIGTLAPFESTSLQVSVTLDASTMIGQILSFEGRVFATGDVDLTNNDNAIREPVVGAYDPNDKAAAAYITPEALAQGEPIEYTIRFENTGNFYAEKVVIKDVLESNLNPATFRFISSSHPCTWKMKQDGTVEFTFNQIFLFPNETGFVRFSVEGDRDLALNEMVSNTGAIYFDFNAPIITNTVKTTVQYAFSSPGLAQAAFRLQVSPNPTSSYLLLELPEAALDMAAQVALFDQTGTQVITRKNLSSKMRLDLLALSAGMYEVVLFGRDGKVLGREKVVVVE